MSDRCDRPGVRPGLLLLWALAACQPVNLAQTFVPVDGGTPCSPSAAVRATTVAITEGILNPWCVEVPAGTVVTFLNQDPVQYELIATGATTFDVFVAPMSAVVTPPLATGTVEVASIQEPATGATFFVR